MPRDHVGGGIEGIRVGSHNLARGGGVWRGLRAAAVMDTFILGDDDGARRPLLGEPPRRAVRSHARVPRR